MKRYLDKAKNRMGNQGAHGAPLSYLWAKL